MFSLASALLIGTIALSLTACSSEDNIVNNIQQPAQGEVHTYTVSIPAIFTDNADTRGIEFDNTGATPAIITKFVENEKVYVYNKTTSALLTGNLVVKNVSADKKSCELEGELTGTISADNEVALLYNLNQINSTVSSVDDFYYRYANTQDGTAEKCVDGAKATMKVKEIDASNNYKMTFYAVGDGTKAQAKAAFTNVQSMFRFQFADATAPTTPISVKTLNIQSKNTALADRYYPMKSSDQYVPEASGINVTPAAATDAYLYVALCIKEASASDDVLYFCVTDGAGNAYKGTKAAPSGGFKNGKYYYNSAPITLEKLTAPTITWTHPSTAVVADANLIYSFDAGGGGGTPYDITVSSACKGYGFNITSTGNYGTIRLHNLNATWKNADPTTPFIKVYDNVTIELTGDNSITCDTYYAINSTGNLRFSCTGSSATLTVTASHCDFCGLFGDSNYTQRTGGGAYNYYPTTTELDVTSQLAASGYTVTRSARTDNADGTYTWTYTVAPALGYLYYSDGTYSSTLIDGKTPIGVIAYLDQPGPDDDEITEKSQGAGHGLVLCLKNAASGADAQWSTEISTLEFGEDAKVASLDALKRTTNVSGYTNTKTLAEKTEAATKYKAAYAAKNYTGLTAPAGTTGWFLPSAQQWVKMQTGLGELGESSITWESWFDTSHTAADKWEAALAKAGDGNYDSMTSTYLFYWSSSEYSAYRAVYLGVDATATGDLHGFCCDRYNKGNTDVKFRVRPVLAF